MSEQFLTQICFNQQQKIRPNFFGKKNVHQKKILLKKILTQIVLTKLFWPKKISTQIFFDWKKFRLERVKFVSRNIWTAPKVTKPEKLARLIKQTGHFRGLMQAL